jgi:hypothetical protein
MREENDEEGGCNTLYFSSVVRRVMMVMVITAMCGNPTFRALWDGNVLSRWNMCFRMDPVPVVAWPITTRRVSVQPILETELGVFFLAYTGKSSAVFHTLEIHAIVLRIVSPPGLFRLHPGPDDEGVHSRRPGEENDEGGTTLTVY